MPREVVADDVVVEFVDESTDWYNKNESDFFFELEWPSVNESLPPRETVNRQKFVNKKDGKPPRPPLRSIASKAFITKCKDKSTGRSQPKTRPLSRSRSFSFIRDSLDKRSLLSQDENWAPLNFDESSDLTSDLLSQSSVYSAPVPYTVPMEQRRLKKQMKRWKSRVNKSMKSIITKRQYRTISDKLFGGIEAPLKAPELVRRWNRRKTAHRDPYESPDENSNTRNQNMNAQQVREEYPSKVLDFATHSPSRTDITKAASTSQPNMTVSYENDFAQLVFSDKPFDDEEIPFDEKTFESSSSSPSDEDSSAYESPLPSSPTDSPDRPLGVSFSHPSFVKRQQEERTEDYGADWENLGDSPLHRCALVNPNTSSHYMSVLRENQLVSPNRIGVRNRYKVPSPCRTSQNFPFDEALSDKVVQSDPYGNGLGFEVVPNFDKVLKLPSIGKKAKPVATTQKKKRPVCHCVKCSAKSVYADLYTV